MLTLDEDPQLLNGMSKDPVCGLKFSKCSARSGKLSRTDGALPAIIFV